MLKNNEFSNDKAMLSKTLNAKILRAEKTSFLAATPIGLISGLIAYSVAPAFPVVYSLVIGTGTVAIVSVLLYNCLFGKDLPKQTINPEDYGTPLSFYKPSSDNTAIQAYNRANGNPSANFIMPPNN